MFSWGDGMEPQSVGDLTDLAARLADAGSGGSGSVGGFVGGGVRARAIGLARPLLYAREGVAGPMAKEEGFPLRLTLPALPMMDELDDVATPLPILGVAVSTVEGGVPSLHSLEGDLGQNAVCDAAVDADDLLNAPISSMEPTLLDFELCDKVALRLPSLEVDPAKDVCLLLWLEEGSENLVCCGTAPVTEGVEWLLFGIADAAETM